MLDSGLSLLELSRGDTLDFFHPTQRAFFPITAVISCVARLPDGSSAQIALLNHDHCIGVARCFLPGGPTGQCSIFIPGVVISATRESLFALKDAYPDFLMMILGLSRGGEFIFAHQAVCAASHPVGRRVASWLMYAAELCGRLELDISQQQFAEFLSARRETVGTALAELEDQGIISRTRGTLAILSPDRLMQQSCGCASFLIKGHRMMQER